jgi:hypothetical protein
MMQDFIEAIHTIQDHAAMDRSISIADLGSTTIDENE